jgi:Lipocalin-like domain
MAAGLRDQLIGAWKLISYEERPTDGSPSFYPMSEKPIGIIMYTPEALCQPN